jgi:hypothetical protein
VPGQGYDVQRASDLAGSGWSAVASNLPGNGAVIQFTNQNAAGQLRLFYRVRLEP